MYPVSVGIRRATGAWRPSKSSPLPGTTAYLGYLVNLGALWLLAWRLPRYTMRDGIVFGAAVGFGFAAFETAGYAFNAALTLGGLSLTNLVETEVLRGILTPSATGCGRPSWAACCSRPPRPAAGCASPAPWSVGMCRVVAPWAVGRVQGHRGVA